MAIRESSYGYWRDDGAFVAVAVAATIGIGNVTRLPALAAEHGGGAFLLCYIAFLLVLGWPLMVSEMIVGRWARHDVVSGFSRAAAASGAGPAWHAIGWLMLAGAAIVLSYTGVIAGWSLAYTVRAGAGVLSGADAGELREVFLNLARDPERSLAWHTLFMVGTATVVAHGVRDGLERAGRYALIIATVAVTVLAVHVVQRDGAPAAIWALIEPRVGELGWTGVVEALHLAFFSVSAGLAVSYALAAYLRPAARVHRLGGRVILLVALLSLGGSAMIWGIAGTAAAPPGNGLALIFRGIPLALPAGWSGIWPALTVYALIVTLALASAIVLLEALTIFVMERLRTTRVSAATGAATLAWFLGLGTLLSFNVLADRTWMGRSVFEWLQWTTVQVLAPIAAMMLCVFLVRIMPRGLLDELWGDGDGRTRQIWRWLLNYPARVLLILLLLDGFGVIDGIAGLYQ